MTRRKALVILGSSCGADAVQRRSLEIRGMYSSPKAFWDKRAHLKEYSVNALFVHAGSITSKLVARANAEGARVFAEFPTLNGKGYVEEHPEAWPINDKGERTRPATWFMGACPTEPQFRTWRMRQLDELLNRFNIAGVWLDYFHWHAQFEDPNPILPETCFSPTCLSAFETTSGIRVPRGTVAQRALWILARHEHEWRDWRTRQLLDWAREVKDRLNRKRPGALLGIYHCPWTDDEFDGARRRILGLDLEELVPVVDVFSPMVYHGRMRRRPDWVGEYVEWLSRKLRNRAKIWPIVQAHSDPTEIPADEFEKVLRGGISGAATGIMMFTAQAVAADQSKMQTMRRLYREWE